MGLLMMSDWRGCFSISLRIGVSRGKKEEDLRERLSVFFATQIDEDVARRCSVGNGQ